jgi:outer membrane protein OmpA-like peptidoglycan-associated protein
MGKRNIRWGNIIIVLLIIAAAVYAVLQSDLIPGPDSRTQAEGTVQEEAAGGAARTDETAAGSMTGAPSPDRFVMGLDSWIGGTPSLMALSREYNRDYSLDFGVEFIPSDSERIAALDQGLIQATEISLPSFVKQLEKYPDCGVIVGITDFSRGADGIVAKSEVKDLNDMEGRKVSYVRDGTGKFILNKFLRLTGLRYQDIVPVEKESMSEVIGGLKSGDVDLAVSWSPDMNLAVKEMNSEKAGSVKLLITTKEVPNLIPTVLVVSGRVLESDPGKVSAFLKTWYASSKYIIEKPDRAYEKLVQLMNENEEEYGRVALADVEDSFANIKLMSLNDNFGYFGLGGGSADLAAIINDTVQTWKKYGDIADGAVDAEKLYSAEFMKALKTENDAELLVSQTGEEADAAAPKEFVKQDETSVDKNTEKVAKVDIPPIYYDSGKAAVRTESFAVLDQVVDISVQFPEYYIIIDAHTDSVGSEEANLKLSRDRAEEVRKYLVSRGVNVNRIVARGWGEYRPVVAAEKTEADKAANRRTEFTLTRDAADE